MADIVALFKQKQIKAHNSEPMADNTAKIWKGGGIQIADNIADKFADNKVAVAVIDKVVYIGISETGRWTTRKDEHRNLIKTQPKDNAELLEHTKANTPLTLEEVADGLYRVV